jgi:hypothetical protein
MADGFKLSIAIGVAFVAGLVYVFLATEASLPGVHVTQLLANQKLPLAKWTSRNSHPEVFDNSFVNQWSLLHWTLSDWQHHLGMLDGVYHHHQPYFGPYYDVSKPLSPYTTQLNAYQTNDRATVGKVLNNTARSHRYFSQEIERLSYDLLEHMQPMDELVELNPSRTSINLWLGNDVTAHPHYDGYHNVFCQLHGTKTFVLVSPAAWRVSGVFPFLHPSHAQVTANWSTDDDFRPILQLGKARGFIAALRAWVGWDFGEVYQITLEPGQVLYVPPLWFHWVTAVSNGVVSMVEPSLR